MSILEVEHIRKTFDHTRVLQDISFSLEQGQVVSISGRMAGLFVLMVRRCLTQIICCLRANGISAGNACILGWYSSPLTCFRSIRRFKMLC